MSKKKVTQEPKTKLTPEDRALLVAFINKSRSCVNTVLECGSDWASTLHEVDSMGSELGKQLGFEQEHWYGDFE
jgi:hypothetical protein